MMIRSYRVLEVSHDGSIRDPMNDLGEMLFDTWHDSEMEAAQAIFTKGNKRTEYIVVPSYWKD